DQPGREREDGAEEHEKHHADQTADRTERDTPPDRSAIAEHLLGGRFRRPSGTGVVGVALGRRALEAVRLGRWFVGLGHRSMVAVGTGAPGDGNGTRRATLDFGLVSHPSLGLPPRSTTAGYPDAAARIRAAKERVAARALEIALDRDRTMGSRYDQLAL